MPESFPPIPVEIDDEIQDEGQVLSENSRALEAEAEEQTTRTSMIRKIIDGSRERVLGRYLGNPWSLELNPMGEYAINHFDKVTGVATHIRISRSGEIVAREATQGQITNKVPVTINHDDLLRNFTPREKAK
ncbi:MAG TPA: hypothetical protein VI588_01790 [Candidatus Gracilibacteria bacterium]|nr:hypothetical protein [Candidatus Gracilibacteria bacterium]